MTSHGERPAIRPTITDVLSDPSLFGARFAPPATWATWTVVLKSLFALPMTPDEAAIYTRHTGRSLPPTSPAREAWLVVGRRGGKSRVAALVAVYLACFRDYRPVLAAGERGTIMLIAADRRQARVLMRYVAGLLDSIPMLSGLIQRRTAEAIHLSNRISIEIHTASFRSTRGYTIVVALCDEIAFWRSEESANPDGEIVAALRPGMATVPGALLVCISSPYARRGAMWDAYAKHVGQDNDPVLVWQADTRSMNPTVDPAVVSAAYAADEAAASAEYGALFRRDIESFVSREAVEACVVPGRHELPPVPGRAYSAFVDPSGGGADSMTLAIAHQDGVGRAILDAVRERRPPFSPEAVVTEFAALLAAYSIDRVTGDRYAGEWPREQFRKAGIRYDVADRAKSDLYRDLLPLVNSGRVELLDDARLRAQLLGLERRTSRGGRDSIDHGPGGHDDMANAVAGALVSLGLMLAPLITNFSGEVRTYDANGRPLPGPSVEQLQAEADREAQARADASAQQIQEAIAKTGVWFPGD
jgi:hypothetical protein